MIKANCHSDDRCMEAEFDATEWFHYATDKKIIALIKCGFGGDYGADQVALAMADKVEAVNDMFKYIEFRNRSGMFEIIGFECYVNEADARAWIIKNRPKLKKYLAHD